ncbi:MAG: DUF2914 domain-containing protein [Smithellaceae bacterium]
MKKRVFISMIVAFLAMGVAFSACAQDKTTGFTIQRLVVATGIEDREPVGAADTFPADTPKVYCFLEVVHVEQDTNVTFAWIHEGKEIHRTALVLKAGSRWRTRAEKTLHQATGHWKVEIRDAEGQVLKEVSFTVE